MTGAADADAALSAAETSNVAVTGLGFIAGFRARAASVGTGGWCKIVDFERLDVLREWHVKGPATSLSILALKGVEESGSTATLRRRAVPQTSFKAPMLGHRGGPEMSYVAVGRVDGRVLIYNTQGNLLKDVVVDGAGSRVLDVEWIRGPKPEALDKSRSVEVMNSCCWIDHEDINGKDNGAEKVQTQKDIVEMPTEDIFDTMKHQKLEGPIEREIPHVTTQGYMDLFSPVKPVEKLLRERESPKRRTSTRPRPRVTSSTYRSPVGTLTRKGVRKISTNTQ